MTSKCYLRNSVKSEKKSPRFDKNDPLYPSIAQIVALVTMSCSTRETFIPPETIVTTCEYLYLQKLIYTNLIPNRLIFAKIVSVS